MYPQTNDIRPLKRLLVTVVSLLLMWAAYSVFSTVHTLSTTGTLVLTTNDKKAVLSVSQFKRQVQIIGTSRTTVRLPAGTYEVAAFAGGINTLTSVTITNKHTTTKVMTLSKEAIDPTITGLFNKLPMIGPSAEYSIDYTFHSTSNGMQYTITITSGTDQGKADALAWIRSQGYNPANYSIIYTQQAVVNYHYTEGLPPS